MTGRNNTEGDKIARLAKAFSDDIMSLSDDEALAEFAEMGGDATLNARIGADLLERASISINMQRMLQAKAGVAADKLRSARSTATIGIAEARARLRSFLQQPGLQLTLAARNESELSDRDVLSALADLEELGLLPKNGDGERE
ncbi:MAG: hypothetical protein CVT82_15165 [Alphaproteobacteria bacterium HGW-Alphaproteobacteria-4]|jgi:hypothetical protein|nr:MAG: hypothetical protein CVT82_15165 [Alphaproteobacteria bacterium HGW-Alphaproteobacteria-4]